MSPLNPRLARLTLSIGLLALASFAASGARGATTVFGAAVAGHLSPGDRCADAADLCAPARVASFGIAHWSLTLLSIAPPTRSCGQLTAIADFLAATRFTLADGSTLTLSETGTVCAPGKSAFTPGSLRSYGNPRSWSAGWTVEAATGRFAGVVGTGTETGQNAGAELRLVYEGSLDGVG
jgi:hypothetical protein